MKPAPFGYLDPATTAEALSELGRLGDEAKVLAGGQSLVPLCNLRLARPRYLVDINHVDELAYLEAADGYLAVGATVRQRAVEHSPLARTSCPLLTDALAFVGHSVIRERGTICGSLAHADPAAELPTVLVALDGTVKLRDENGERLVAADDFFLTFLTTDLRPDELMVEARFPVLPPGSGVAFAESARRQGDFALVGVACAALPDGSFRLAVSGVGPRPLRARQAEEAAAAGDARAAGELAAAASEPGDDLHASADYRRSLVRTLVRRAVGRASQQKEERARA